MHHLIDNSLRGVNCIAMSNLLAFSLLAIAQAGPPYIPFSNVSMMGISTAPSFMVVTTPGTFIHQITLTDMDQYKLNLSSETIYNIGNVNTVIQFVGVEFYGQHIGTNVSTNGTTGTRKEEWIIVAPTNVPSAVAYLYEYIGHDPGSYAGGTTPILADPDTPRSGIVVEFRPQGSGEMGGG